MKPLDLTNLPFDPAQEAGKKATTDQNTPSMQDSELIEQVMMHHKLTRKEAVEILEAFGS
jgi:hypothetical protein